MNCFRCNSTNANNKVLYIYDGVNLHYRYYCDDCVKSFHICEHCKVLIDPIHIYHCAKFLDGRWICRDCFSQMQFNSCKKCGNLIYDDSQYCLSCLKDKFIHSYSYKPTPTFFTQNKKYNIFTKKNIQTKLFVGIELEMNFDDINNYKQFVEKYSDNEFVYLKHDGSIGNYGVEIVSHPSTFQYHFYNQWKDIFDMFHATNTLGCGLHFHLSKDAFNSNEVEFLDYFINNCTYEISQIGSRALKDYCKTIRGSKYGYARYSSHTDACNLGNINTIELRFCKATNNYKSFMKKIKNIWALIMFVKVVCEQKYNNFFMNKNNKDKLVQCFDKFKGDLLSRI